jgi:hypothetical protein
MQAEPRKQSSTDDWFNVVTGKHKNDSSLNNVTKPSCCGLQEIKNTYVCCKKYIYTSCYCKEIKTYVSIHIALRTSANNFKVYCITGTWLNDTILSHNLLPGSYCIFYAD